MLGVFKIPLLMMDKRFHVRTQRKPSLWRLVHRRASVSPRGGRRASARSSPGSSLLASQEKRGAGDVLLLLVYSLGLAIPFLVTAAAITRSLAALNRIKRFLPAIEATSGAISGRDGASSLVTGSFTRVAGFFYQYVKPPSL
jgi:cytochrome c-type biogenesis protein